MQKYVMLAMLAGVVVVILWLFVFAPLSGLWRDAMFRRRRRRLQKAARDN